MPIDELKLCLVLVLSDICYVNDVIDCYNDNIYEILQHKYSLFFHFEFWTF